MPIDIQHIDWEPYFKHPTKINALKKRFKLVNDQWTKLIEDPQIVTNWYQYQYLVQLRLIEQLPTKTINQIRKEFEKQNLGFQLPDIQVLFQDVGLVQMQIEHFTKLYTNWIVKIDPHFKQTIVPGLQNYIHRHLNHYTIQHVLTIERFKITGKQISHNSLMIIKNFVNDKPHSKFRELHLRNVEEFRHLKLFQILLVKKCQQSLQTKCPHGLNPQFARLMHDYTPN